MIWKPHQAEKEVFWQNLNALGFIKVVSYDFVILISRPSKSLEELIILFCFYIYLHGLYHAIFGILLDTV
jgi:hypothetical protein